MPMIPVTAALLFMTGAPLEPVKKDAWSKPVSGLAGRLRVSEKTITPERPFLANRGNRSLAVQQGHPHLVTVIIRDSAGREVTPTFSRVDVICSPQWGVIPRDSYLGFRVSRPCQGRAKASHLDITTRAWKLPPGKYRISGSYRTDTPAADLSLQLAGRPGQVTVWKGRIELPPIEVEVLKRR